MTKLRFFYSKIKLHWGFAVRVKGATASQPAFILPPPTTIVGAFAYPLARILDLSEDLPRGMRKTSISPIITPVFECFLKSTKGATAGLDPDSEAGLVQHSELSRIIGFTYKTGGQIGETLKKHLFEAIPTIMPVQPMGSSYGPNSTLNIAALIDIDQLAKCLGINSEDVDSIGLKACHGVSRLGSKESIISVLEAAYGEPETEDGETHTIGYVQASYIREIKMPEMFTRVYMYDLDYELSEYLIPIGRMLMSQNLLTPPTKIPGKTLVLNQGFRAYYLRPYSDLKVIAYGK